MGNQIECTLILYERPIERVWRAWADASEFAKWYVAGGDHVVHFCEADVRVRGSYRVGFGPLDNAPYVETGRSLEVVPPRRLVFDEVVSLNDKQLGPGAHNVVELRDLGDGRTELVLTCSGENVWRSGEGWTPCFESLARHLGL